MARFVKESSLARVELLPDIDHMDLEARHETLHMKGEPVMVQTVEGQHIASFEDFSVFKSTCLLTTPTRTYPLSLIHI